MSRFHIVEGQTAPVDVQLLNDRRPVDLTAVEPGHITLLLRRRDGTLVESPGSVAVLDARAGTIRYVPAEDAFAVAAGPYSGRWKVVDESGGIGFWPNREVDAWIVRR